MCRPTKSHIVSLLELSDSFLLLQDRMSWFLSCLLRRALTIRTASHRGAKREFPGSAPESALAGAPGNRGAPESALEAAPGNRGAPESAPEGALPDNPAQDEHPREHFLEHPDFPEHPREHFPEHPDFPEHLREHFPEHFQGIPV